VNRSLDTLPLWIVSAATLLLVVAAIEGGFRLGRAAHARSDREKESPASAIAATILALLAFIMAFTFSIVSDRYDMRRALVQEEANAIRVAWSRSDFLPEPDRGEAVTLLREYVSRRLSAVQSNDLARVKEALAESVRIQRQLWDMAVVNARKDMNSDVAALYIESLNDLGSIHARRVSVGTYSRIPLGIWLAFYLLVVLSMLAVGYHVAIAGSRRSSMMLILALSFSLVITLIAALDRVQGSYLPVSQQPLKDVQVLMGGPLDAASP
jgi:hypothetical protein